MSEARLSAADEWKSGWKLVLAAGMGFSFFALMLGLAGVFMRPIGDEFGWSRTLLASGPSIATTIAALFGPFLGVAIDRYGGRRVVMPGLVATMLAMAAFSLLTPSPIHWIAQWLLFGFVFVSIRSTAWIAAVLGVFQRSRGLALGVTLSGAALVTMVAPPLANWLIAISGWRAALVWLAFGWGGVTFVLCFLFFFDAHDRAVAGPRAEFTGKKTAMVDLPGLSGKEALRDSALWRVGISSFVVMVLTNGLSTHLFLILTDTGISRANAAWMMSLGGFSSLVGQVLTGILLDRFRPNWIGGCTLAAASLTFVLLTEGMKSPLLIVIAMVVNGYASGSKTQITGFLTAGYGGMKNYGAIYGVMASMIALASSLGPLAAGVAYDFLGGYLPFLIAGSIGCALSGILLMSLPAYPKWQAAGFSRA